MFDTNIKQTSTTLVLNQMNGKTSSHKQISTPNLRLPLRQQSVKSLYKIKNHYREFQHALNMLKASVEELWRLELAQLQNHESISTNIIFDLQVPSIYNCRAVLPMASETIPLETKDTASVNSSIIVQSQEVVSNRMNIEDNRLQPSAQSVSTEQKSTKSFGSIDKKRRQYASDNNFTKYWRKTALLHLKFHCSKHSN
jgi:hypothetical protein